MAGQSCSLLRDPIALRGNQQPRQMLFTLRSIALFSSVIAASPSVCGPVMLVPVRFDPADPVVTPPPEGCAVPALLVPGAGGEASLDEFPAPLGSSPALFNPPGLAGPGGTPLMPEVPAPAEPALGEPAALPLPADASTGALRERGDRGYQDCEGCDGDGCISPVHRKSPLWSNDSGPALFLTGTISVVGHCPDISPTPGADCSCAN